MRKNIFCLFVVFLFWLIGLYSPLILSDDGRGVSTGNSSDKNVPYSGFLQVAFEDVKYVVPRRKNKNQINSEWILLLNNLEGWGERKVDISLLFDLYQFPLDLDILESLYERAINRDPTFYLNLSDSRNPFFPFLKDKRVNPFEKIMKESSEYSFSINSLYFVGPKFKFKSLIEVNSQMKDQDGSCPQCQWSDYRSIPGDGINLKLVCHFYRKGEIDSHIFGPYDMEKAIKIESKEDQFLVESSLFNRQMLDDINLQFCRNPTVTELDLNVTCLWTPTEREDGLKWRHAFGGPSLSQGDLAHTFSISFYSQNSPTQKSTLVLAKDYVHNFPLYPSQTTFRFLNLNSLSWSNISHFSLMWDKNRPARVIGFSEKEYSDLLRRAFISSYEETNF